jgi:YrbI family 3-deoxy-D-manno-octulosonate 8-phosphate phosphatase
MKITAFIPVRGGSKSIPKKNIKLFCGKPLVYWNILALEATLQVDQIVVATEDDEIKNCVLNGNFKKTIIYNRSIENSQDQSSTESVMLEYLEKTDLNDDDVFILCQATSPYTQTSQITTAINQFLNSKKDAQLTCCVEKKFYWSTDGKPLNYDPIKRSRRQDFLGTLTENGAFYMSYVSKIKESKCRISGEIDVFILPDYFLFEIDEPQDWMIAEMLMKRLLTTKPKPIKLFASDVDGVLTDGGMYYTEAGDELKKFNTRDGKGFELLRNANIKTAIITSENTQMVERRAKKLKIDYLVQGQHHNDKLTAVINICKKEGIDLSEVAYIGDDINCFELLSSVGAAACPADASKKIKGIPNIQILNLNGGQGVVREFIENILYNEEVSF